MTLWICVALVALCRGGFAEPAKDPKAMEKLTANLLAKEDYVGLDQLAADIKKKGYDLRESKPELKAFYDGFCLESSATERQWLDQQLKLNYWSRTHPESLTAKIALARWYLDYGWKARGTSFGDQVTQDGWNLMRERLRQATQILKSVPEAKVDDPEYYRTWIILEAEPGGRNSGCGKTAAERGVRLAREYYPLYLTRANFMLPKWFGQEGDWERFLINAANSFPGEKGDMLYARIARAQAHSYGDNFFNETKTDYGRVKRGFLAAAAFEDGSKRTADLSNLCYLATIQGDKETALKLAMELGDSIHHNAFGSEENFLRLRKESGVEKAVRSAQDQAVDAEHAGDLAAAEKSFAALQPGGGVNPWLTAFYLREGLEGKLRDLPFSEKQTFAQILDADVAAAEPNTLAELAKIAPQVGNWEKAEAAARAFDQKRPWNLIGKNTLWLCALHRGDAAAAEAVRREILNLQTNRAPYLAAQAVLGGSKTWEQAQGELKPGDIYNAQAAASIALHYYSIGQAETARKALEAMLPVCNRFPEKPLLESMLYGSVSRALGAPEATGSAGAVR